MTLVCVPDMAVPLPFDDLQYPDLHERATAACNTISLLLEEGLPPESVLPTHEDRDTAAEIVKAFAADADGISQSITTAKISALPPATVMHVKQVLDEFSHSTVQSALQIRHLVTNKLILESENPDARIRLRALELLGKISDVGLFTERSEVTITARSSDELRQTLREKLERLRAPRVIDAEVVENVQKPVKNIDLDQELGVKPADDGGFDG